VVLDNTGLADLPSQLQPQFIDRKNWHMATWSDGNQSFFLATTANEAELKKLFS